jgi:TetR/AcrR family transcriptional regulator
MKAMEQHIPAHHDARKQILDAAEKLFADKGFDATSISDITEASGVVRSLIYYYFKDKRDLYISILKDGEEQMLQIAKDAAATGGAALDRLRNFITNFLQMLVTRQNLIRLAMRAHADDSFGFPDKAEDGFVRIIKILMGIVEEGIAKKELRKVDPELTAHMVMGFVHSLAVMQTKAMPDSSSKENVEFALGVLAQGIAHR